MKAKKRIPIVVAIIVVLVIIIAVIGRKIYIEDLKENIEISITSVSIAPNPSEDEWWLGKNVGDVLLAHTELYGVELSKNEQQMQYDLNQFNVYQVDLAIKNATEDIELMVTPLIWCKDNEFIWVMDDAALSTSKGVGEHKITQTYFISKTCTPNEIEQHLASDGMPVKVSIKKNNVQEITSYEQQIYLKK